MCRHHGVSETKFSRWGAKYGGMQAEEAVRPKALEDENAQLKRLPAAIILGLSITIDAWVLLGKR